jgi:hypothetical protein
VFARPGRTRPQDSELGAEGWQPGEPLAAGLADGEALNLDFHAVMLGRGPGAGEALRAAPSQRTRSVLTFFAEDAATRTLLYASADLSKATQNREVTAFADDWHNLTGHDPALLIFDSKLTTQAVLTELDDCGIGFITLRARHPATTTALAALPATAWASITLGRAGNTTRRVRVHDDPATQLSAYPRPIRQPAVTGLGHDQPTLLITNRAQLPACQVIQAYARRMNIERRLAEAIQSFSLDALAGAVPLNVDLDVVLSGALVRKPGPPGSADSQPVNSRRERHELLTAADAEPDNPRALTAVIDARNQRAESAICAECLSRPPGGCSPSVTTRSG